MQTDGREECHIPEPQAFLMQLRVAFVSEDKNPVQLLPPRRAASLIRRTWWVVFTRLSSHPIICLLVPPPLNALSSGSKEILFIYLFIQGWEKSSCRGAGSAPRKHTATAEMEHQARRKRTSAAASAGS